MNEKRNIRTDEEIKDYLQLWDINDKTQILIDTAREFEEQYYNEIQDGNYGHGLENDFESSPFILEDEDLTEMKEIFRKNGVVLYERLWKEESEKENDYKFTFENFINDEPTAERIVKIIEGMWKGVVNLVQEPNLGLLACQIGDYWFYFTNDEEQHLQTEVFKRNHSLLEIAWMILDAIIDLDDEEYDYYCDILEF